MTAIKATIKNLKGRIDKLMVGGGLPLTLAGDD